MDGLSEDHVIFVYGTLKRGFANHHHLAAARFLATGVTVDPYPLVISESWNVPVVIDEAGNGFRVEGELFAVRPPDLQRMDDFEDVGRSHGYLRKSVLIKTSSRERRSAWIYVKSRDRIGQINSACLSSYPAANDYIVEALRGSSPER
jgi:gamma-glutamylaminecyclotransferase